VSVALRDRSVLTPEFSMHAMLSSVAELAPRLANQHWSIEYDRKARFMTSDTPLVLWGAPTHRDAFEGFGVESAEEIRFPLDPAKQLVLAPPIVPRAHG
jgi:hypothetical protein